MNKEEIKEFYDSEADLDKKVEELAKLVLKSKHMVAYTGAGISTSAGIPDFRGPDGVWTLKAAKKKRTTPTTSVADAKPTLCHMALVQLQNTGRLKYLVSTNCDGLHIKSGINPDKISEVHGNSNVEACSKCGAVYYRQSRVKPKNYKKMKKTRVTGRVCSAAKCRTSRSGPGDLRYTSVAFSQSMPDVCLDKAEANSEECDLALTMGTSMRVSPSCDLPSMGKKKHGKDHSLVIVNLQKTPYDEFCRVRIFAKIDDVISLLFKKMEQLVKIKVGDMVTAQEVGASPSGQSEEKMVTRLPGKVAKVNDDGTYDIQFTSNKSRKQCPRSAVEMFAIPPWQGLGYQTPEWVAGFQKNWPFRNADDVTWFAGGRHINKHMRKFAQVTTVPDLSGTYTTDEEEEEKKSALKQLKICVRSVENTHKDFLQYCREQEDANVQLAKMIAEKADESTTRRQKDLVEEADNMAAESMKNFESFLRKLEDFLTENTQLLEGTKKINTAQTSFQFFERKLAAAKGNESSTTPTETPTTTTTTTYTTTTTTTMAAVTTTPKQKVNERNFDNENVNTTTGKMVL